MPSIQDLLASIQGGNRPQMPPQQAATPQLGGGVPQQQGNPLAQLAPQAQQQQPQQPAPNAAQTAAAIHHFGEIKAGIRPILNDPKLGKENIRPKLLDAASKFLASKTLSLPDVMKALKNLPDDPMQQLQFVKKIYDNNDQAQQQVLAHHAAAPPEQQMPGAPPPEPYSQDNHQAMMDGLMQHYGGR
jgi:hypothetical protein